MPNRKNCLKALALLILALFFLCGPAAAHRVSVFAWTEGDRIVVEGYFSGGAAARESKIEVFGPAGKKLLEGVTDQEGRIAFPRPDVRGDLRFVLTASMGHKGEFVLTASELGVAEPRAKGPAQEKKEAETFAPKPLAPAATALDEEALDKALDRVLEKKLKPLFQMIAELKKDRVSPTEVAGGIGYIVGILGIFAYFKARQMRGRD